MKSGVVITASFRARQRMERVWVSLALFMSGRLSEVSRTKLEAATFFSLIKWSLNLANGRVLNRLFVRLSLASLASRLLHRTQTAIVLNHEYLLFLSSS